MLDCAYTPETAVTIESLALTTDSANAVQSKRLLPLLELEKLLGRPDSPLGLSVAAEEAAHVCDFIIQNSSFNTIVRMLPSPVKSLTAGSMCGSLRSTARKPQNLFLKSSRRVRTFRCGKAY